MTWHTSGYARVMAERYVGKWVVLTYTDKSPLYKCMDINHKGDVVLLVAGSGDTFQEHIYKIRIASDQEIANAVAERMTRSGPVRYFMNGEEVSAQTSRNAAPSQWAFPVGVLTPEDILTGPKQ